MATKQSTGDLLKMLKGISSGLPDNPPEGFYPNLWWAKQWGLSPSKSRAYISKGIEAGLIEHANYYLMTPAGRRKIPHYKINKQPTK